ncbi:hypothetical protein [Micrococcoides hystricis]|uniref:Uncharacterized protein n=1 Tax=Micrococcoides hystricis TaxID=1572761 RepID=A0ABV6PDC9_9MICC
MEEFYGKVRRYGAAFLALAITGLGVVSLSGDVTQMYRVIYIVAATASVATLVASIVREQRSRMLDCTAFVLTLITLAMMWGAAAGTPSPFLLHVVSLLMAWGLFAGAVAVGANGKQAASVETA